uniref:Pentacotripeptide-repeat region of PRORP domain-containing protein n=1 Tax=Glycine max TaxID=3847 RepID=K7MM67_SOYBN
MTMKHQTKPSNNKKKKNALIHLIQIYADSNDLRSAVTLLHQISHPNVFAFTSILSFHSRHGLGHQCIQTYAELRRNGVVPDGYVFPKVLKACAQLSRFGSGRGVHKDVVVFGEESNLQVRNSVLDMYSKCGDVGSARQVFDEMSERDVFSWNSMMSGYVWNGLDCADNVFWRMDKSDVVTWNAMIFGLVDVGLVDLALDCFREMQGRGVGIDGRTISSILPVCDLRCGKEIHAYVRKCNFSGVIPVYNALIHMYSIRGCIAYAYSVFSTMVARDLVSWNTIIGGFGTHGLGQTALELLQEMSGSGVRPDLVTFSCALSACSHSGLVNEGIELFYRMTKDFSMTPAREHFSCVVDMLARAGRLEDAFHFINQMPQEPNNHVWGALLAACQEHQNISVGKLAAEKLISLEPHEAGHYVTLSNIYSRAGRWDDAARVRKMMDGHGLLKPSGHSLVGTGS